MSRKEEKLAVIFPGIGYHTDRPLLYYSKKMAKELGYEIAEVNYTGFSKKNMIGNREKMYEAYCSALEQSEKILADVKWKNYTELLFISKSVGTAAAIGYAKKHGLNPKHVWYTPVEQTFRDMLPETGIAFHGTADPWVATKIVEKGCDENRIPLMIIPEANHSLETGHVLTDVETLMDVMKKTWAYISLRTSPMEA